MERNTKARKAEREAVGGPPLGLAVYVVGVGEDD